MIRETREGKEIYREGKIEVRSHDRDPEAHNVWIGDNYFLFMRGCLEQFARRTQTRELERALGNYNPSLPYVLRKENIFFQEFALVLASAMKKEDEDYERFRRENGL
jgi:hypothetical protein